MLSNVGLRDAIRDGQLAIEGLKEESIQPASIDLHLDYRVIRLRKPRVSFFRRLWLAIALRGIPKAETVDPYDQGELLSLFDEPEEYYLWFAIEPGEFLLAATERVAVGNELVAQVAGKSSVARFGLMVESAGYIDPGFDGSITLELFNQLHRPLILTAGMPIAQLAVTRLDTPADISYAGKYNGSVGPVASRYYLNARPGESV